jgi:hypothetical protein
MFIALKDLKLDDHHLSVPHRAVVVENNDPLKLRRVQCTITDLFDDTDLTALPWIYPLNNIFLGGSVDSDYCAIPEIGSELVVVFPFNDIYFPFYIGYWVSDNTKSTEFDTDYPDEYGWKDSTDNIFKVNKKTGNVTFTHSKGTIIKIDGATGNVTIGDNSGTKEFIVMEAKLITKFNAHTHPYQIPQHVASTGPTGTPTTPWVAGDVASKKHKVGE